MNINRVSEKGFTAVSNEILRDNRLSLRAKGFMAVILGLPADWVFSVEGMAAILKENRSGIYAILKELKTCGYCETITRHDAKGRIAGSSYVFSDAPRTEKPHTDYPYTEKPYTEKPHTEKTTLYNKEYIYNKENIQQRINGYISEPLKKEFTEIWAAYDVGNPAQGLIEWEKLTQAERGAAVAHLKEYIPATPEKYRKNIENYLREKYWNTKIKNNGNNQRTSGSTSEADFLASEYARRLTMLQEYEREINNNR